MDTIVALSSGRPPAAIAVLRVSGPQAIAIAGQLAGPLPAPRCAGLRALRDGDGALLDRALVLFFPGPASATGEDLVELHCHGGQAVVRAVEAAVRAAGARAAEPGEFTRRAVLNGRMDLAQAEGLADLLEAETEAQRRAALQASEGRISGAVKDWMGRAAGLAAEIELAMNYDEEDVADAEIGIGGAFAPSIVARAEALRAEMLAMVAAPPVERVRDGVRVVIAGPPNAGKSTLLNLLAARQAAIVSPVSGTTRDRIEVPVQRGGIAYLLTDTAGLIEADDPVERIGVTRAAEAIAAADVLLWLGDDAPPRTDAVWVNARADLPGRETMPAGQVVAIRQDRAATIEQLWGLLAHRAEALLPMADDLALKARHRYLVSRAAEQLLLPEQDPVLAAEHLRLAVQHLASILGVNATEATLDALFARFCLGK